MAQNTKAGGNGCATGILRGFGVLLLISGLGNVFSGDMVAGMVVAFIGAVMLMGGKSKQGRKGTDTAARHVQQVKQQVAQQVKKNVEQATRPMAHAGAGSAGQPRKTCPNPEPHRHFDLQQTPPTSQVEKMVKNRKTLYEAGLLTREEYDAEVRKLRGR